MAGDSLPIDLDLEVRLAVGTQGVDCLRLGQIGAQDLLDVDRRYAGAVEAALGSK